MVQPMVSWLMKWFNSKSDDEDVEVVWDQQNAGRTWSLLHAMAGDEGVEISVFEHEYSKQDTPHQRFMISNGVERLKTLRHRSIVKYEWKQEDSRTVSLITERVVPLQNLLGDLTTTEVCLALYQLCQGLQFLHDICEISHNNLCFSSLFISSSYQVRIGLLDHAVKLPKLTADFIEEAKNDRDKSVIAPEDSPFVATKIHTRDIYAFGKIVQELQELKFSLKPEDKEFAAFLQKAETQFCNADPKKRPTAKKILTNAYFKKNALIKTTEFLRDISSKTQLQKKRFLGTLLETLEQFPSAVIARSIVPLLLRDPLLFQEPALLSILPQIFHPKEKSGGGGLITLEDLKSYAVTPLLSQLKSRNRAIRYALLKTFPLCWNIFLPKIVKERILPEIWHGLHDDNENIVGETLITLGCFSNVCGLHVMAYPASCDCGTEFSGSFQPQQMYMFVPAAGTVDLSRSSKAARLLSTTEDVRARSPFDRKNSPPLGKSPPIRKLSNPVIAEPPVPSDEEESTYWDDGWENEQNHISPVVVADSSDPINESHVDSNWGDAWESEQEAEDLTGAVGNRTTTTVAAAAAATATTTTTTITKSREDASEVEDEKTDQSDWGDMDDTFEDHDDGADEVAPALELSEREKMLIEQSLQKKTAPVKQTPKAVENENTTKEEDDFFKDMEPVYQPAPVVSLSDTAANENETEDDFFKDMEPVYQPAPIASLGNNMNSDANLKEEKPASSSLSFGLSHAEDEGAEWSDDDLEL